MPQCNCYVSKLGHEALFCVRNGAHDYACPRYHESLDPVDRYYDQEFRTYHMGGDIRPVQKWPHD